MIVSFEAASDREKMNFIWYLASSWNAAAAAAYMFLPIVVRRGVLYFDL